MNKMKAVVVEAFPGRPDHEVMTRCINVGETITGDLARVAVREGWAEVKEVEDEDRREEGDGLDTKTVKELTAIAAKRQVDLGSASKKADILAALRAAVVTE